MMMEYIAPAVALLLADLLLVNYLDIETKRRLPLDLAVFGSFIGVFSRGNDTAKLGCVLFYLVLFSYFIRRKMKIERSAALPPGWDEEAIGAILPLSDLLTEDTDTEQEKEDAKPEDEEMEGKTKEEEKRTEEREKEELTES